MVTVRRIPQQHVRYRAGLHARSDHVGPVGACLVLIAKRSLMGELVASTTAAAKSATIGGVDGRVTACFNFSRARIAVYAAAQTGDCAGKAVHILQWMELRLVEVVQATEVKK